MDVAGTAAQDTSPEVAASFDAVYAANAGDVYRFCLSIIGDAPRAEDAAAQALASAYARFTRAAPPDEAMRPWLFRIARNAAIDELRRESRWRRLVVRARSVDTGPRNDVVGEVIIRDDLRSVIRATAGLGARDRLIVSLRAAAGLEHAEVAAVLGITENAAKVAAHRALRRLRDRMEASR